MTRRLALLLVMAALLVVPAPRSAQDIRPPAPLRAADDGRCGARPVPGRSGAPLVPVDTPSPSAVTATVTGEAPAASLRGIATWYCLSGRSPCTAGHPAGGSFAAAGPALRAFLGPDWRGSFVTVTAGARSVRVQLVDACLCPDGRVIDLYSSVVRALGLSLSSGVYRVTVRW